MKYRSKPVEVEAMQWTVDLGGGMASPDGDDAAAHDRMVQSWLEAGAEKIVAWVNANGGEARYEPEQRTETGMTGLHVIPARIMLHTSTGRAPLRLGDWAINSSTRFTEGGREYVDHYPCDPETFERRWEAVSS